MLLYPAIDVLKTKVDSKYTLAVLSAKRARDLIDDKPRLIETENNKPISIATAEIAADLISFTRLEETPDVEKTVEAAAVIDPDQGMDAAMEDPAQESAGEETSGEEAAEAETETAQPAEV